MRLINTVVAFILFVLVSSSAYADYYSPKVTLSSVSGGTLSGSTIECTAGSTLTITVAITRKNNDSDMSNWGGHQATLSISGITVNNSADIINNTPGTKGYGTNDFQDSKANISCKATFTVDVSSYGTSGSHSMSVYTPKAGGGYDGGFGAYTQSIGTLVVRSMSLAPSSGSAGCGSTAEFYVTCGDSDAIGKIATFTVTNSSGTVVETQKKALSSIDITTPAHPGTEPILEYVYGSNGEVVNVIFKGTKTVTIPASTATYYRAYVSLGNGSNYTSGTYTVKATVPGYGTKTSTLAYSSATPTVTFANQSVNVGASLALSSSCSSGATPTYSISSGGSYVSLSGSTLTGVAAGSATVLVTYPATGCYAAATATATITVNAAAKAQTLTMGNFNFTCGSGGTLTATSSAGAAAKGQTVSWSVNGETKTGTCNSSGVASTAPDCTWVGSGYAAGSYPVTASIPSFTNGGYTYAAASASSTLTLSLVSVAPTLAINPVTTACATAASVAVTPKVSGSATSLLNGQVVYLRLNGVTYSATVSNGSANFAVPTTLATGSYVVTASTVAASSGCYSFLAGSGTGTLTVTPSATAVVTFVAQSVKKNNSITLTSSSTSGGTPAYSIVSGSSYATLSGATLTGVAGGSVVVRTTYPATGCYAAATKDATITVTSSGGSKTTGKITAAAVPGAAYQQWFNRSDDAESDVASTEE